METKEYIVVLHKDIDYDAFWNEIENLSPTDGFVPSRRVNIANNRSLFKTICEYWLTDEEAELLKNDPRVLSVEQPVRNIPNVSVVSSAIQNIPGMNYTKQAGNIVADYVTGSFTSLPSADYTPPLNASTNWGLIRHSFQSNPYPANPTGNSAATTQLYNYVLNGSGVDIIINDSGIQGNHPEFSGRILNVNWNSIAATVGANTSFNWNTASYTDTDGHGTNIAGIAAGATYGWAKGASIIPLYINFSGQSSAEPLDMFEMMIYWHRNKGNSNPTVVNMSWDLRINFNPPYNQGTAYYSLFSGGSYRGSSWAGAQTDSFFQARGLIGLTGQGWPAQGPILNFPYSSSAYNAALGEVINAGIVVCQAAGNNGFKIDVPGGDDYNNYVVFLGSIYYYHRGASPKDTRAIVVGALDTKTSSLKQDQRAQFSGAGPGVDIWAAGAYIMSAGCTNPAPGGLQYGKDHAYYLNGVGQSFKEWSAIGTSQASPQIAGMAALYLQAYPPKNIYSPNNCSTVKSWLTTNALTDTFYSTGNSTSYTNGISLLGGQPRVAYQNLQGLTRIKTNSNTWASVANVCVKTSSTEWSNVKTIWTKVDSDTWKQTYTAP